MDARRPGLTASVNIAPENTTRTQKLQEEPRNALGIVSRRTSCFPSCAPLLDPISLARVGTREERNARYSSSPQPLGRSQTLLRIPVPKQNRCIQRRASCIQVYQLSIDREAFFFSLPSKASSGVRRPRTDKRFREAKSSPVAFFRLQSPGRKVSTLGFENIQVQLKNSCSRPPKAPCE